MFTFNSDLPALPRTLSFLDSDTSRLRKEWGFGPDEAFDCRRVLALRGTELIRRSHEDMGAARALTAASKDVERIFLRSDLYDELFAGTAPTWRANIEIAHELSHVLYHRGEELKPFVVGGNKPLKFLSDEERTEPQANRGARAFCLPRSSTHWGKTDKEIASIFLVPTSSVVIRRQEIADIARELRPKADVSAYAAQAIAALSGGPKETGRPNTNLRAAAVERAIDVAWDMLEKISGESPSEFRLCRGFKIQRSHYLMEKSHYGWHMRHGKITPYLAE